MGRYTKLIRSKCMGAAPIRIPNTSFVSGPISGTFWGGSFSHIYIYIYGEMYGKLLPFAQRHFGSRSGTCQAPRSG